MRWLDRTDWTDLGQAGSCHWALAKSEKYFHSLLFLQFFRPAQQALGWSNSPRFRGGLSGSCSSCRGTWLLPPWLSLLGASERCDHAAGPEVTPSWELRYSCISPTWLRPPTPRYNYCSLLPTHHSPSWPGGIRLWYCIWSLTECETDWPLRELLQRKCLKNIPELKSKMFCKLWTSMLCLLCKISWNKIFQKIQELLGRSDLLTPEETAPVLLCRAGLLLYEI